MAFFYLVRRISPAQSVFPPLVQVVAFGQTEKQMQEKLGIIQDNVPVPPGTIYTIEKHRPNISGRDISEMDLLSRKAAEERNAREAEEVYNRKVAHAHEVEQTREHGRVGRRLIRVPGGHASRRHQKGLMTFPPVPVAGNRTTEDSHSQGSLADAFGFDESFLGTEELREATVFH